MSGLKKFFLATVSAEGWPENSIACDPDLSTGSADGSSWEDAYQSLQAAINACSGTPDKILVKARTVTLSSSITVSQACTIYGGFDNSLTGTQGSVEGRSASSRTTLDGIDTYQIATATAAFTIDAFRFEDGSGDGGALYSNGYAGTFVNCIFDGNTTVSNYGGALYFRDANVTLTDCEFTNNDAARGIGKGGALAARDSGTVTATDCTFGSSTNGNIGEQGGAVAIWGGAGSAFTRCTFAHNACNTSGTEDGGGCHLDEGTHTFTDCIFTYNLAGDDAGAIWQEDSSTVTLNRCLFDNNDADDDGGAIEQYSSGGTLNVNNCTFADNSAADGEAIKAVGTLTVINSIFWDNTGDEDIDSSGTTSVTYSDVEGGYTGTGNLNIDPNFSAGAGGKPYYQPDTTSDVITEGNNAAMTDHDILGDDWDDDTMGCYNLDAS